MTTSSNEETTIDDSKAVSLNAGVIAVDSRSTNSNDVEEGTRDENDCLLCPITKQRFQDAVVNPSDGLSYERAAIESSHKEQNDNKDTSVPDYYPNRALMDFMDPSTNPLKEVQTGTQEKGIFVCPITQDLLRDPVIDSEGNTYERSAITGWIQKHGVSPITRMPLRAEQLYDNTTLFLVLKQEIQKQIHNGFLKDDEEEIQAWKRDLLNPPKDPLLMLETSEGNEQWQRRRVHQVESSETQGRHWSTRLKWIMLVSACLVTFVGMKVLILMNTMAGLIGLVVLVVLAGIVLVVVGNT